MKPLNLATSLLLASLPLASAWHLQRYRNAGYQVLIVDRKGTNGQPCANLPADLNDQVSSMHWDAYSWAWGECTIRLFRNANCQIQIGVSTGDWHIPNFSPANNDQLSSYRVDC
ncbi:hypothetical protein V1523DRAFT_127790 [Lipomyces doorenjongii]